MQGMIRSVCSCQRRAASTSAKAKAKKGVEKTVALPLIQAANTLKALNPSSISWAAYELTINTRLSPTQNLNAVRGRVFPPFAISGSRYKGEKILVFAPEGPAAESARAAGADYVGGEELVQQLLDGSIVPTRVIAHPSLLAMIGRSGLAPFLGPKGLMPSTRRGTVTTELATAIQEARGGLDWRADSRGVVRTRIGRLHLPPESLAANIKLLVNEVADLAGGSGGQGAAAIAAQAFSSGSLTTKGAKKGAVTSVLLSTTQGPSIEVSDVV